MVSSINWSCLQLSVETMDRSLPTASFCEDCGANIYACRCISSDDEDFHDASEGSDNKSEDEGHSGVPETHAAQDILQAVDFVGVEKPSLDIVDSVSGMYRILDLVSEEGSGGYST